jgi:outer membrane protein TolC
LASGAYLSALAVDRNLEALNDIIRESEKDIKEAEDLKEKGLILGADFYLAKMIYGNLKMMRTKLEKEKTTARILMNIMAGAWYDRPLNLSGTLPETYNEPAALSEIIDEALKNRPDLVAMDMNVQAQKAELSREKLSFLPKVAGFGGVQENSNDLLSGGASYEVGVKTELDVFDPSYSGRVKEQKEKLRKLKGQKNPLKTEYPLIL